MQWYYTYYSQDEVTGAFKSITYIPEEISPFYAITLQTSYHSSELLVTIAVRTPYRLPLRYLINKYFNRDRGNRIEPEYVSNKLEFCFSVHRELSPSHTFREFRRELNEGFRKNYFSEDILSEIERLIRECLLTDSNDAPFHPQIKPYPVHNEVGSTSNYVYLLNAVLDAIDSNDAENQFVEALGLFLVAGESPNKPNQNGLSLFDLVAPFVSAKQFVSLIHYEADPRRRSKEGFSVYEYLSLPYEFDPELYVEMGYERKEFKAFEDKYNVCRSRIEMFSRIAPKQTSVTVNHYMLANSHACLETEFRFTNGEVCITVLKKASALTLEERTSVNAIYQDNFIITSDQFDNDLTGEDKAIELLYDVSSNNDYLSRKKMIGFNLFQLLTLPHQLYVHGVCSALIKDCRIEGLMSILAFRFAFALPLVFPSERVGMIYIAIDYDSYRMAKRFHHYPRRQLKEYEDITQALLTKIYGHNHRRFTHNVMTCYVTEKVRPKNNVRSDDNRDQDPSFQHYYHTMLNRDPTNANEGRGVPVMFHVAEKNNTQAFYDVCTRLQINGPRHLQELAEHLRDFMRHLHVDFAPEQAKQLVRARM